MKLLIAGLFSLLLLSCNSRKTIVEAAFVDSLIKNYTPSTLAKSIEGNTLFWQKRYVDQPGDFVAQEKYAHSLLSRFHLYTDIADLQETDSLLTSLLHNRNVPETGNRLTMVHLKLLEHQFDLAPTFTKNVEYEQSNSFATAMLLFDVDFERGDYQDARLLLQTHKNVSDYAYNFRLSKLEHLYGAPDSAIFHMLKAASIATNTFVKAIALSNAADLYLHSGKAKEAYDLYRQCIAIDHSDFHSIEKLGWISLVHDNKPGEAQNIFRFLEEGTKSPQPLLDLAQSFEVTDSVQAKEYAQQFVSVAGQPQYGNMYNKYLIEAYTGILKQPAKAVEIARRELMVRQTPQSFAWMVYALACDNKLHLAYDLFRKKVSGQPLEGLELFWMGKMMQMAGKGYNAEAFFEAAKKNEYDLSPGMAKELNSFLE
ncbi:MAG: tetratricopeptide repeat protein [Flavisolibacter sp.]